MIRHSRMAGKVLLKKQKRFFLLSAFLHSTPKTHETSNHRECVYVCVWPRPTCCTEEAASSIIKRKDDRAF